MHLVYCDLLMNEIRERMKEGEFFTPDSIQMDLDENGAFVSTKKTMEVIDSNGTKYRVTVEEA